MQARVRAMTDDKLDIKTYSLAEVAEMVLPPDMTNGVRWLSHRLNRGELSGYQRRVAISVRLPAIRSVAPPLQRERSDE
jgi:hypothetical protein